MAARKRRRRNPVDDDTKRDIRKYVERFVSNDTEEIEWTTDRMVDAWGKLDEDEREYYRDRGLKTFADHLEREGVIGFKAFQARPGATDDPYQTRLLNRRGKNPNVVTFMGNPRGIRFGSVVQAILYRHTDDGKEYVHVFGDKRPTIKEFEGHEWLRVDNLPLQTGTELLAVGNDLVLRNKNGKSLSDVFIVDD